ncbi:hypothetical protein P8625_15715 [Tenacibaculum tangerinum]|uniref:HTH luxR-type domain-containing protein n=1 Tax=Tenacibaculum tangerinum TaxID=3038772 RepID=A0ABY8L213_9FLAO|nr:hypothetical protein [Tenacibaculum tangerinum]WGH75492.1 hypothetical protein P8625_15715 [Tenacibaculum tangerinum]
MRESKKIGINFFYVITLVILLLCRCSEAEDKSLPKESELSYVKNTEVQTLLTNIKKVEHVSLSQLRHHIQLLDGIADDKYKVFVEYYTLKAAFFRDYNRKSLEEYISIYPKLKDRELYKLMIEVDIYATYFYYDNSLYKEATHHVKQAFEYCFRKELLLERTALIYGLSPTTLINTPEEKEQELLAAIKEIENLDWSFYHSRIWYSLAKVKFILGDYGESKKIILKCIENDKKINSNFSLASNYMLYAWIDEKATNDYKAFINHFLKSLEYKNEYGNNSIVNYRMIGHMYFENDKFEDAYNYYQKSVYHSHKDSFSLSHDYAYMGYAYFKMNPIQNFNQANKYYDLAISYSKEGETGKKMAYERKIWSLRELGRTEESEAYELKFLRAKSIADKDLTDKKFEDFRVNTMLGLRLKNYRINTLRKLNALKDNELKSKKLVEKFFIGAVIMSLTLLLLVFFLRTSLRKNKKLNTKLSHSLTEIEEMNSKLEFRNNENSKLLELNEKTLFSKVLKISTYKDAINSLAKQVGQLLDNDEVKARDLLMIEKGLKTLITEDEIWIDFQVQFEKTRPNFFKKLKEIAPDLTVNELKHCTYIVSKLRIKDVANLTNRSPRSVETARYRLKKKIGLQSDDDFLEFLQNL